MVMIMIKRVIALIGGLAIMGAAASAVPVYADELSDNTLIHYNMDTTDSGITYENSYITETGQKGNAIKLNGGYAKLDTFPLADNFTIAAWVKPDALGSWSRVFDFGKDTGNYIFLTADNGGGNAIVGVKSNGGAEQSLVVATPFEVGEWTHIALTLENGELKLFADGEMIANRTITIPMSDLADSTNNYIGKSQYSADAMFFGTIDEMDIANYAMTESQITDLMAKTVDYLVKHDISYRVQNGVYTASANMELKTYKTDKLMAAVARYDDEGAMVQVKSEYIEPEPGADITKSLAIEFDEAEAENAKVIKAFLWRAEDMSPVTTAVKKEIEKAVSGAFADPANITLEEGSLFEVSREVGYDYINTIDVDRLLAPCYEVHGLSAPNNVSRYAGWEMEGWSNGRVKTNTLAGHSLGHWMSAAAAFYRDGGEEEILNKLNYAVDKLDELQQTTGSGYIGGCLEDTFIKAFNGDTTWFYDYWVPWYGIHKIYQGLIDAYTLTGNEKALEVVIKFADWAVEGTDKLSDSQMQTMLNIEYGGMNEVFAELYDITGDEKYLTTARRFTHDIILNPLIDGRDELTKKHANTQIPKIIGAAAIYEQDPGTYKDYKIASENFWDLVVNTRSYAIGGNSISEHFEAIGAETLGIKTAESCNSYNMLKLTEHLFSWEHDVKYMDYYETLLYNHILGQQDPVTGAKEYFISMLPGHHRIYGTKEDSWWCCTGTGMENPGRYTKCAYYEDGNDLYVNLYMHNTYKWEAKGLTFTTETNYPYADTVVMTVTEGEADAAINLRAPSWLSADMIVSVNGTEYSGAPGEYLRIDGSWKAGDVIEITLPMDINVYYSRAEGQIAYKYGGIVLAQELREITDGSDTVVNETKLDSNCVRVDYLLPDTAELTDIVEPVDINTLTFRIDGAYTSSGNEIILKPFYEIHHHHYNVYWSINAGDDEYEAALRDVQIDRVEPDGQQDEIGHSLETNVTGTNHQGTLMDGTLMRYWRDAWGVEGAYFQYTMTVNPEAPNYLFIRYWGMDSGFSNGGVAYKRDFNIYVDDNFIADQQIDRNSNGIYDVFYEIPEEYTAGKESVKVKLEAKDSASCAGGALEIRTMTDIVTQQ